MERQVLLGNEFSGQLDAESRYLNAMSSPNICFKNPWISKEAHFRPCFLPVVAGIPSFLAALILAIQTLRLLIPWRARWMRPFVEDVSNVPREPELILSRRWTVTVVGLILVSLSGFTFQLASSILSGPVITAYLPALAWAVILVELFVYRPRTVPYSVLAILVLQLVAQLILIEEEPWQVDPARVLRVFAIVFGFLMLPIILVMPFRDPLLESKSISQPFTEASSSLRSPEEAVTVWEFMTIAWMTPLMSVGTRRQLQDEDVWSLPLEFQHRRLHENFREIKGTVIQRLVSANAIDLIILVILGLIEQANTYVAPVMLQLILSSMEDPSVPKRVPMVYATIALASRLISAQLGVFLLWFGRRCYERSRGEMITMLYEKTLNRKISLEKPEDQQEDSKDKIANGQSNGHIHTKEHESQWNRFKAFFKRGKSQSRPKEPTSTGKLLNLMRNDVYEVSQRFWEFDSLVRKPISVVLSITLVVNYLGWPSMMGVGLIFVTQLINAILARVLIYVEKKRRKATDDKLEIVSQFIEAIRHLRWYGWQGAWLSQIMDARHKELMLRLASAGVNLGIAFSNTLGLDLSSVLAFAAYVLITKKPLTIDIAFPALQLFGMMTFHLKDIPELVITLINAWVAVGRIEDFMAEPDKIDTSNEGQVGDQLAFEHATFAWPGSSSPVLKDIDLSFHMGINVICGEVASGKTALLQALLGELDIQEGQLIRPQEAVGYCAQSPWLQSMSIRENILFSAPYDDTRYKAVLDACALTPDLAEFKAGDLSLIGENGIGLSGGQRARVALARAVYSRTNILLLDDPLSALDQQTAEAIVRNCFTGPLFKDRTVVLVTHRTDLVAKVCVQAIKLEEGRASPMRQDAMSLDELQKTPSKEEASKATAPDSDALKAAAVPEKFIEDEHRAHGGVMAAVYWQYIKAGTMQLWGITIVILAIFRLLILAESWFIKTWGEAYNSKQASRNFSALTKDTIHIKSGFFDSYPPPEVNIRPWLLTLLLIALGETTSYVLSQGMLALIVYTAGKNMFRDIMDKVAHATFRFYDVTPVGRLMNRMTSDIAVIDGGIAQLFQLISYNVLGWLSAVVVIASVAPTFLVFTVLLLVGFIMTFRRFIPTSQSLRRLEMVSLTPLISNFGALINGLTTVRAFSAQDRFQDRVIEVVDTFQRMDHFYWSTQAWIQWRYDVLSAFANFFLYVLAFATDLSPGLTAFVMFSAARFVLTTHALCRQYGQLQMEFVSVERVVELLHLDQEPEGTVSPPAWWPSFGGDIVFDNVTIKYAPHMDPALSSVSFTVKGGSKTAVLGRTGSGKSTLALSMLATIIPDVGKILVDNVDLADVDKQLLRTRVTFLAQDPVLFPGSMRQNLDPVDEHSDEDCELVLRRVCERQGWSLDTHVEAGGKNLSQGQRQLVGLARAVLRRSAIIILDEATASIDRETAMQIQEVMHEEMKDSTVITIAHRLEAVKNADYCIVLGKGKVIEQGPAAEMLNTHGSDLAENVDENDD